MIGIVAQTQMADAGIATAVLFYFFAAMAVASALAVVISRNIVRTAVALLFTLGAIAGLYFLLNAEFLAAVQLVVYAGGTLILIVFGIMLTSKSPFVKFEPKLAEAMIALSVGVVLLFVLVMGIFNTSFANNAMKIAEYPVESLGQVLLGDYLVPFEVISVLLLVVMIGAAYLAKGRRRETDRLANPQLAREARQWS